MITCIKTIEMKIPAILRFYVNEVIVFLIKTKHLFVKSKTIFNIYMKSINFLLIYFIFHNAFLFVKLITQYTLKSPVRNPPNRSKWLQLINVCQTMK